MRLTAIPEIQGTDLYSPLAGETVRTRGVVTGSTRKGYFIQVSDKDRAADDQRSQAVFVFSRRDRPPLGALVEVEGKVHDFRTGETDRPTTQIAAARSKVIRKQGPPVSPVPLDAGFLDCDTQELSLRLNRLEAMLVSIAAESTFVAPSNSFGDYVLLPPDLDLPRTPHGGVLIDPADPHRWLPGFRIVDYSRAACLNVGARLLAPVVGPLNYRAQSFQVSVPVTSGFKLQFEDHEHELDAATLRSDDAHLCILTLNGFNLDPHIERASLVHDPRRDVDDDIGDERYSALAHDVVHRANSPDIVALQEIQDDDGAEITDTVDATRNYRELTRAIKAEGGPAYSWADIPPVPNADGGQPGGNIRNAFLFDPARVELVEDSLRLLGDSTEAFEDSRKALMANFRHRATGSEVTVLNLHLASKRHQHPIFSADRPGFDPREEQRIAQAAHIRTALVDLHRAGTDYYVTGDFNDYEFSKTLRTILGEESVNLVESLGPDLRYDYNHRGMSEALLHAVVSHAQAEGARYEILHGNELLGVMPGTNGGRATDHAYGLAQLRMDRS
jgi:predicted extracellular nuclease